MQAEFNDRDVLIFNEAWFNQKTSIDDITLENYKIPYRCDRGRRIGGGVTITSSPWVPRVLRYL